MSCRIELVDYDPEWPRLFRLEATRIRSVLGPRALRIEHTGSTSVPELAAKPIIDILLIVVDTKNEATYLPHLESVGYRLQIREPEWHEHRMFKGPDTDVNLHVFSTECPEINKILAFRERLRTDEGAREIYSRAKRKLAQKDWNCIDDYADAKAAVIEMILSRVHPSGQ